MNRFAGRYFQVQKRVVYCLVPDGSPLVTGFAAIFFTRPLKIYYRNYSKC